MRESLCLSFTANSMAEEFRGFGRQPLGATWTLSLYFLCALYYFPLQPTPHFLVSIQLSLALFQFLLPPTLYRYNMYFRICLDVMTSSFSLLFFCTSISRGIHAELKTITSVSTVLPIAFWPLQVLFSLLIIICHHLAAQRFQPHGMWLPYTIEELPGPKVHTLLLMAVVV